MENPMNSLLGMHPRYVWLVELLQRLGVPVPWLLAFYNHLVLHQCFQLQRMSLLFWVFECNHLRPTKWDSG